MTSPVSTPTALPRNGLSSLKDAAMSDPVTIRVAHLVASFATVALTGAAFLTLLIGAR